MTVYKFVHLFLHDSALFNGGFQEFVERYFDSNEHLFVYKYKKNIPIAYKNNSNTICDETIDDVNLLTYYTSLADFCLIHNLKYNYKEIASIGENISKKIVWVVWGGDLYRLPDRQNRLCILLRKCYHILNGTLFYKIRAKEVIRHFAAISAVFSGDRDFVRENFGYTNQMFNACYPMGYFCEDLDGWIQKKDTSRIRILLGHSGFSYLNHEKYINLLKKHKEKIQLVIPLSYGDNLYIKHLKEIIKKQFNSDEAIIVEQHLTQQQYCSLLSTVDMAIIDCIQQSALGNLYVLFYLRKSVYLNIDGALYKGFVRDGLDIHSTDELFKVDLENFDPEEGSSELKDYAVNVLSKNKIIENWNQLFEQLYECGDVTHNYR